jgi:hypothetical protein
MTDKNKTVIVNNTAPQRNHIIYVLDGSGSMDHCFRRVRDMVNEVLKVTRAEAAKTGIETFVSVVGFGGGVRTLVDRVNVQNLMQIGTEFYDGGGTPLRDGVAHAIHAACQAGDDRDPNMSILVNTYTDGGENTSQRYRGPASIKDLMDTVSRSGRWTFTFQVPRNGKQMTAYAFGYDNFADNIREWDQDERGVQEAARASVIGTQSFYASRSLGKTAVDNYYATTNLTAGIAQIAQNLTDVSDQFKTYDVGAEDRIDVFVAGKTGDAYKVGQGYYLLVKPELVQGHKKVLIQEKGKRAIWTGDEARKLIGLADSSTQKVTPGNHSNYNIYVQSTSVNRILPRGTKVAVDTKMKTGIAPTWDHEKAAKDAEKKRAKELEGFLVGFLGSKPKATLATLTDRAVSTLGEPYRTQVAQVVAAMKDKGKLAVVGRSFALVKKGVR